MVSHGKSEVGLTVGCQGQTGMCHAILAGSGWRTNQFSAALTITAPGKQPANGIASQIAGAQLAGGFLLKVVLRNQCSAALATLQEGYV